MKTPKQTIAIVENDCSIRRALEYLLPPFGYNTATYATAQGFLAEAAACKADCLVLDIHLDDGSGLDLARHPSVRALQRPIVFMSGTADQNLLRRAFELSGTACVRKPFSANEILTAIKKATHAL
jgi:FixJ family two-component response regulator